MGIVDILVGMEVCSQWDNEVDKIDVPPQTLPMDTEAEGDDKSEGTYLKINRSSRNVFRKEAI